LLPAASGIAAFIRKPLFLAAVACALGGWVWYGVWAHTELRAGYNQFAPYVRAAKDGKPEGIAAEMLQRAADAAGIRLRWVYIPRSADEAFAKKQIDIYPLLTITKERKAALDISQAWWEGEIALTSPEAQKIGTARETAGKRIATRLGTVEHLAARLFPKAQIVPMGEMDDIVAAMCAGQVDAFFVDLRVLQARLLQGVPACPKLPFHIAAVPEGNVSLGTAAAKDRARPAAKIYREIARLSLDGTLSELAQKWGVFSPYQSRHMQEVLDSARQATFLRWGLTTVTAALVILLLQTRRLQRARTGEQKSRREADESQHRFDAFMTHTPAVTYVKDDQARMVYMNDAFCKQVRKTAEELKGKSNAEVWPPEIARQLEQNDREVLAGGESRELIETVPDASGEQRTFLSLKFPFVNSAGQRFLGGISMDITDRKEAEEALRFSQFSIDRSPDMVFWMDAEGRIIYANRAACQKLGFEAEELRAMSILDIDPTLTEARFRNSRRELRKGESMTQESYHRTREGEVFPVEVSINYLEFDGQEFSCTMSRDITDRKRAEEELFQHARYDALTGLMNRRLFERRLEECVVKALGGGGEPTVFYLDLDGFKLVNDTLGHAVGDAMLRQVALRLQSCVREGDTLARMGGDEFTLISTDLRNMEDAIFIGRKLLSSLRPPFHLARHELLVTASIGISRFPRDGQDGSALLQSADAAMYEAKHKGKNQLQFFTQQMREAALERLDIEHHLRHAVERGEMELHYQPQVCLKTGETVRFEALLRWNHPAMGMVPPAKFIPVAEDTFCIVPMGNWVLEQACRAALEWRRTSERSSGMAAGVAVNISPVQFARPDFYDTVCSILDKTGLEPGRLELELTETVAMSELDEFAEKISRLRALGVKMAIDDFGTGYSSLSYLQKLPFDVMKIDGSFASGVTEGTGLSVVRALVSLAHSLNMKVVMEGIETEAQLEAIRDAGCDLGQGYLLGVPAPAGAFGKAAAGVLSANGAGRAEFLDSPSIH
jgi:diguanylate cyclase (GGDEF)-like protein/PAS domain S-box-containing protein